MGSQVTGSQVSSSHGTGLQGTRGTSYRIRSSEDDDNALVWEVSLGKRKPKWLQDTLKEAKELLGSPKRTVRESKPCERFCCYIAMVTSVSEPEPSNFEEVVDH